LEGKASLFSLSFFIGILINLKIMQIEIRIYDLHDFTPALSLIIENQWYVVFDLLHFFNNY
jgi:hypothetical protein